MVKGENELTCKALKKCKTVNQNQSGCIIMPAFVA